MLGPAIERFCLVNSYGGWYRRILYDDGRNCLVVEWRIARRITTGQSN